MPYRAGSAFIAVSPSFRGFQTKAAAEARRMRPIKIPIQYDEPTFVPRPSRPVKVPVVLDGGSFERNVRRRLAEAIASLPNAEIGVATNAAEQKLKDLRAEMTALSSQRIGVDITDEEALAKVRRIKVELARLGAASPSVQVKTDVAAAIAELAVVQEMADRIDGDKAKVNVDADTGAAVTKLTALQAQLAGLAAGRFLINVGIVAAPIAGVALGAGAGALGGLGAIAAGGLAGVVGGAALGIASMKHAIDLQKKQTEATKAQVTAVGGVKAAQKSLASAEAAAAGTRIQGDRSIADAKQAVGDARRNAARSIETAEQRLAASQTRVGAASKALHVARVQEIRDLQDLRAQVKQNVIEVKTAQMAAMDAQANLADVESNIFSTSTDITRARLAAAAAEQKLSDTRRKSKRDSEDLAKAEKNGTPGVQAARQQLQQARDDRAQARKELAQTRADAARSIGRAEQNLARTRADAARSQAQSAAQVADAQAGLAAAEDDLATAQKNRLAVVQQMTPAQKKALASLAALKTSWWQFLASVDTPLLGAMGTGMGALSKTFRPLARFIRPVARALDDVFAGFGRMASSKSVSRFARQLGVFSGGVIRDAGRGTRFLIRAFMNLFRAFMPLGNDMSKGLVRLMRRFRDWSAGLDKSKGFQRFIAFTRRNGPLVMSTLGAIGGALIAVGRALAPLGVALLKGLRAFANWISKTAEAHPTLIRVVGAIALFTAGVSMVAGPVAGVVGAVAKFIRFAMAAWKVIRIVVFNLRILFFVLRLSPIGMVVTALGLLVVGFVLAYKKVGWFRRLVDGALKAVKNIAVTVFGWIKKNWPLLLAILTGPFGLAVLAIAKNWDTVKKSTLKMTLWVIDKMLWMAEKVLGVLAKLPGKMGEPFRTALDKVKDFRAGVNAELDAISDEKVNISLNTITIRNAQKKNDRQLGNIVGGRGPLPVAATHAATRGPASPRAAVGGGGIFPQLSAPMGPVRRAAAMTQSTAHQVAQTEAERIQEKIRKRRAARGLPTDATAPASSGLFGRPVKNYAITATWQSYPGHTGIDLAAPTGTPVFAAGAGKVLSSYDLPGSNPYNSTPYRSYGRVVEIQHNGFSTLYAHLSDRLARPGQLVARGALIGAVGMNGNATGPHLHFETRPGGQPVNPVPFMAARGLQFDSGGELPQGLTMAYHAPRKPDKVLTDGQFNDMHQLATRGGAGGAAQINLYDADNQLIGRFRGIARGAVNGQRELDGAHRRAGQGV